MKNFYKTLEIEKNATEQEVKKAYNKLLRKYPPEKEPEKYKEIREAYDTLRNDDRRKNYDVYFNHGAEIQKLEEQANQLIEKKQFKSAEKVLKKILIISSNIVHIRELLGDVLFFEEKYANSIEQFNILIKKYNNNSNYYFKRGCVYEKKKDIFKAENDYLKAYSLDYENLDAIGALVYLYISQNKIDEAITFLNKEIYRDNSLDFADFFCLSKLIECYIFKKDKFALKKVIADIQKIAPEDEETRTYMSWKLATLALDISEANLSDIAYEVINLAKKIHSDDNIEKALENIKLYKLTEELMNDKKISFEPIKGPIFYYMHGEKFSKKDREENLKIIFLSMKSMNSEILREMKTSLNILKNKYNLLYIEQKEIYDKLEKELEKEFNRSITLEKEFKLFVEDNYIDISVRHCITALQINNEQEFKRGLERLKKSKINALKQSLSRLDSQYPNLKKEHSEFISELRKLIYVDKKEGCYIATAVYGNYDAEEVLILRKFRDKFLKKYFLGRNFIKLYYTISPILAKKLKSEYFITKLIKKLLDKFVSYLKGKDY